MFKRSSLRHHQALIWEHPTEETKRLEEDKLGKKEWKRWGPYLSERQWGTVREDYSRDGNFWEFISHDHARSRAFRWGEDGLLGMTDNLCQLCFGLALWNEKDPILKERLFGLTPNEGNHGEDVKECYYYLDSTPTHSYMKALYKYPQNEYPYGWLVEENKKRSKSDPEFELSDTGVFNDNRYWDVLVEYAKNTPNDILINITLTNRGPDISRLHVLPCLWYRNTWIWGCRHDGWTGKPCIVETSPGTAECCHEGFGRFIFVADEDPLGRKPEMLFTDNETNTWRLFNGSPNYTPYVKDAFHRYVINGEHRAVNTLKRGTKMAPHYVVEVPSGGECVLRCRLMSEDEVTSSPFSERFFGAVVEKRKKEAEEFYNVVIPDSLSPEESLVSRQSYAGLLWNKQFYTYIVDDWISGDEDMPPPPYSRREGRNSAADWKYMHARDIVCVPDKWEYPGFSTYELALSLLTTAKVDPEFAKDQLLLLLSENYMSPSGQMPAYEFALSDVIPPVHALACHRVYKMTGRKGHRDNEFLARCFQKLLVNFTWWANLKDASGKGIFGGGFVGLNHNTDLNPDSLVQNVDETSTREDLSVAQADGTAWMAFYCVIMLGIALDLAVYDPTYEDMASKFFEHFTQISDAMNSMADGAGLWDDEDGFYYDRVHSAHSSMPLRTRAISGLIPMLCCVVIDDDHIEKLAGFRRRIDWFLKHTANLANQSTFMDPASESQRHRLLAIPTREQLSRVLRYMLDENEFLSPYGIRSLSLFHKDNPVELKRQEKVVYTAKFIPGESEGNTNYHGPVWLCLNYLIVEALERYDFFYGDTFKVDFPSGSGNQLRLRDVAVQLSRRLASVFLPDERGRRPCHGDDDKYTYDVYWNQLVLFYEFFNADTGKGCGASHNTGQSAFVSRLIDKIATAN